MAIHPLLRGSPWSRALAAGFVSDVAYLDDPARRRSRLDVFGLEEVGFIGSPLYASALVDPEAVVVGDESGLVVAFRGSEVQALDWLDNAEASQKPFFGPPVHAGIGRVAKVVFPAVLQCIREHGAGRSLWLCGHSLGGAVAVLTAWALGVTGVDVAGVVTFGAPRIGGLPWAGAVRSAGIWNRHEVWVNQADPVSRLPTVVGVPLPFVPGSGGLIWMHVGKVNVIEWERRRVDFDLSIRSRVTSLARPTTAFDDHKLLEYRRRVWALAPPGDRDAVCREVEGDLSVRASMDTLSDEDPSAVTSDVSLRTLSRWVDDEPAEAARASTRDSLLAIV